MLTKWDHEKAKRKHASQLANQIAMVQHTPTSNHNDTPGDSALWLHGHVENNMHTGYGLVKHSVFLAIPGRNLRTETNSLGNVV
jgi:hypothetical protein